MLDVTLGLMPGDSAASIEIRGAKIGVVGLNSAWLQLGGGKYKGGLHVDHRQLLSVLGGDPDSWCQKNDINFIVTHHPLDWLHEQSRANWQGEIDAHGRFDFHMFGHMHEPSTVSVSVAGSDPRRSIQAASLFGLEEVASAGVMRIHGYAAIRVSFGEMERRIDVWPRKAMTPKDGIRKLVADQDFNLDENDCFEFGVIGNVSRKGGAELIIQNAAEFKSQISLGVLNSIKKKLNGKNSFIDIRRTEQAICLSAFDEKRTFWLVSDWGLGADEFLQVLQSQLPVEAAHVFEIDCHEYFDRKTFLSGIQEQLGCSFEQLCEVISLSPSCILILDVPIGEGVDKNNLVLQTEIEFIADAMLQYCDNIRLVVKSRLSPINCSMKVVELRPLDEADTSAYISSHVDGGEAIASPQFSSQIFRHTDGMPARIDAALRDISIVGLSALHSLNSDVTGKTELISTAPLALVSTIAEMNGSPDPGISRALELLKALTMFPRGEQLSTVKRFNRTSAFYPQDARILMDWALVDSVEVPSVESTLPAESGKALLVRRSVREYLYGLLSPTELKALNKRSLSIYFGEEWSSKGIKPSKNLNFDERSCGNWKIGNASMMVLRAAREAADAGAATKLKSALTLSASFCASLLKGYHYGSVVALCNELIPIFESVETISLDLVVLKSKWAAALRMCGEDGKSRDIYVDIQLEPSAKPIRQEILLNLAYCYESLKDNVNAIHTANSCVKLNASTAQAMQAKSIVIGLDKNDPDRNKKLRQIETEARKKKMHVVANNVALNRAEETKDGEEKKRLIHTVAYGPIGDGDHHNRMRAIIKAARMTLDEGKKITQQDLARIISSYYYLYGESFKGLFNVCHDVLWQVFEMAGQTENLIRLFRYSSLTWRLRGEPQLEVKSLMSLGRIIGSQGKISLRDADRELAYFIARTSHVLKANSLKEIGEGS